MHRKEIEYNQDAEMNPTQIDLITNFLDGEPDERSSCDLRTQLAGNPQMVEEFYRQLSVHAALEWKLGNSEEVKLVPKLNERKIVFVTLLAMAGAAALCLLLVSPQLFNTKEAFSRVKSLEGVELRIKEGTVYEMKEPGWMRLVEGEISVVSEDTANAIRIDTPNASFIDVGTRFGVRVTGGPSSQVAVADGVVEISTLGFTRDRSILAGPGESFSVTKSGTIEAIPYSASEQEKQIIIGDASGLRRLPARVVVTDSAAMFGAHDVVTIPESFREGVLAFSDRPHAKWVAVKDEEFPGILSGGDFVRTFQQFRWDPQRSIEIRMIRAGRVWILADTRSPAPAWLSSRFEKTDLTLWSGPWRPSEMTSKHAVLQGGHLYVPYAVWRGPQLKEEQTISTGSPGDAETSMYGIVITD